MKFGICLNVESALRTPPIQADYVELSASQLYTSDRLTQQRLLDAARAKQIELYSCNNLIPPHIRLTGENVNFDTVKDYCDILFERLAELGIQMLVFGSGKSRQIPDGFPMEKAWEQLFEVGYILSTKAKPYGQTIAVEPLAYGKVNIINTVADATQYAKTINQDNFKALVDFYHFDSNGEPFDSLRQCRDWLVHTHFATAKTRTMPKSDEDWAFFSECVRQLLQIGYSGRMSFEGGIFEAELFNDMIRKMKRLSLQ